MSYWDKYVPGISIDCVIFGFHHGQMSVLLLDQKFGSLWSLPGGFLQKECDADEEAIRILKERTGLDHIFLDQFYLFGKACRSKTHHVDQLHRMGLMSDEDYEWFHQRFVTLGYYALVEYSRVNAPTADKHSNRCEWKPISELPELILDHTEIVHKALETLQKALNDQPIGLNLLPEYFTMTELQLLYETVLDKKLDRRNFRRKMLAYDILLQTDQRRTGGAHKPPVLYKFDEDKYKKAIENGFQSIW